MLNVKSIIGGLVFAVAGVTSAAAENFSSYGAVEGWNVYVDDKNASCVIEKVDEDMIIQMGLTKNKKMGYLGVFTKGDNGLNAGSLGDFIFFLDNDGFHGEVINVNGKVTEGYSGSYLKANNPDFIDDVANKHMFKAVNKDVVFEMSLAGTKAAMEMGRKCISEQ